MKVFVPNRHHLHRPSKDFSDGLPPFDHMEQPERIDMVKDGLRAAGVTDFVGVEETAPDAVFSLHDHDYVEFLFALSDEIEPEQEYLPSVFHDSLTQAPTWFRGGAYCREIGTPIGPHTVEAALNSAATAITAAEHTLRTGEDCFALCRPPGHHAGRRRYGGYSFFNNAYLAAELIRKGGRRTAVLDIDYHVGDGSTEFASAEAPYFSLHAHPGRNYPYLASLAGAKLPHVTHAPIDAGIDGKQYLLQLNGLLGDLNATQPEIVILSLGFDTLGVDYIQDEETAITARDFTSFGKAIARLTQPVVMILEGGYDPENLKACVENFFQGYLGNRKR